MITVGEVLAEREIGTAKHAKHRGGGKAGATSRTPSRPSRASRFNLAGGAFGSGLD